MLTYACFTGFSVSRSFREAPRVADEIMAVLKEGLTVEAASSRVWAKLWPLEKRTQVGTTQRFACITPPPWGAHLILRLFQIPQHCWQPYHLLKPHLFILW